MNSIQTIASAQQTRCFHCGEDVPPGTDYSIEIAGAARPMCCPGCRAVAGMIAGSGLERFYEQRTAFNERPPGESADASAQFAIYDDPALAAQFSAMNDDGICDARLLIGGVSCAACTWLIETTLKRLPGVEDASLNLNQGRLDLRFDPRQQPLSVLMARVAALGYRVQPWHSSAHREQAKAEHRQDLRRLAVAGIGMMQVGMFAIALHAGDMQGIRDEYRQLMRLGSLLVATLVVFYSARGFFESALRHLRHGALVMDLPVALAIGFAFAASSIATLRGSGDVYFDSVAMFTFLLLLARFLEKSLRYRDALLWEDAEQTLPDAVQAFRDSRWMTVPRRELAAGDRVLLRGGDTVPIDGEVLSGSSAVREDSFSGEALPRSVGPGDEVFAGTLNTGDSLEVRATGSYAQTRLAALQRSIESARHDKPAVERLADRVASRFIAAILLISSLTALVWWQLDASRAFWVALSVLVISCPCALSLATPSALANAASLLRRHGIIVHGENALEALSQLDVALFDKTGTLTSGEFELSELSTLDAGYSPPQLLGLAAALQRHSNHPLAAAFAQAAADPAVNEVRYRVGAGLEGRYREQSLRLGSLQFCREIAPDFPAPPDDGLYWIGLCVEQQPLAWFGLSDELRPEAPRVVEALNAAGIRSELLTGDASGRAKKVGELLGLNRVGAGLSPQDKLQRVAELQAAGATVLMVGDGLNDAPVLKRANVSIAVAGATDLARAQADFVILEGNLEQIVLLHRLARQTRRVIIQNFCWALGYNLLGIPLAALGLVPPWIAAVGMSLSSLLVVANAWRLRGFRVGPTR